MSVVHSSSHVSLFSYSVLRIMDVYLLFVSYGVILFMCCCVFFFQAEDGIRDLVRSRGLGDVYKRQKE